MEFPNKTAKYIYSICKIAYFIGLPNFWIEDLKISKTVANIMEILSPAIIATVSAFILMEFGAVFTQKDLNEAHQSTLIMFVMAHPVMWSYPIHFSRQKENVKQLIMDILKLKEVYIDAEVEKRMIRTMTMYTATFLFTNGVSMVMYVFNGIIQVSNNGTFTTIITAWPMVDDHSTSANIQRIFWNVAWWWMLAAVLCIYAFVFNLTCSMSYQYIDLQSYFYSLDNIFKDKLLSRKLKELKYEQGFKVGIKLHSDTLRCVRRSKSICAWMYSSQIVFNVFVLVSLLSQLMDSEITAVNAGAVGFAALCILLGTGLIMCNAGDVTEQASKLCTAMYSSGWGNCQGASSLRVRKLVVISAVFAQRPVQIKGFGIIPLSYESYVTLVKNTYSVFSLLCQQQN